MDPRLSGSATALPDASFEGPVNDPVVGDPDDIEGTLVNEPVASLLRMSDTKKFGHIYNWDE